MEPRQQRVGTRRHDCRPGTLSAPALRLHVYAVLASIADDRAGYVTDDYLGAVRVDTTLPVLELCAAGMWERGDGGYRVSESETIRLAAEVRRQVDAFGAELR